MNRKLRNTYAAFVASSASLAIALMVAVPATSSPVLDATAHATSSASGHQASGSADLQTLAHAVARSAAAASVLALEARDINVSPESRTSAPGARHRRQTLVMPYFSFSPRG